MADTDTERRQHPRTEVALPVTIERVRGRALAGEGATVDLSLGGARLVGPAGFGVGDVVRIGITGDGVTVEHQALVVGRGPGTDSDPGSATLHVAFKTLDERATIDLRRLLGD